MDLYWILLDIVGPLLDLSGPEWTLIGHQRTLIVSLLNLSGPLFVIIGPLLDPHLTLIGPIPKIPETRSLKKRTSYSLLTDNRNKINYTQTTDLNICS